MPGDLRDPEQSIGWHYDPRYDTRSVIEPGELEMDAYLQTIAEECLSRRLSGEEMSNLCSGLQEKGMFHMNPGDEFFRKTVRQMLQAKKVALQWLS